MVFTEPVATTFMSKQLRLRSDLPCQDNFGTVWGWDIYAHSCTHTRARTHAHARTHARAHTPTHTLTRARARTYTHIYTAFTHPHTHTHTHARTHGRALTHTHIFTHARITHTHGSHTFLTRWLRGYISIRDLLTFARGVREQGRPCGKALTVPGSTPLELTIVFILCDLRDNPPTFEAPVNHV